MKNKKGLVFAAMGFELLGLMLAALYIGQYLDEVQNWKGLGVAVLSFVALIAWSIHIYILIRNLNHGE